MDKGTIRGGGRDSESSPSPACLYLLVDGLHEPLVTEELWQAAQVKLKAQAKKYEHVNKQKDMRTHLLTGIVKCPVCGAGMFGNKSIKHRKDGSKYKDFYYYGCKHHNQVRGHKCDFKPQIREELLDGAVAEVIAKLVQNPTFAAMMREKIGERVDTAAIEEEIRALEQQLRQALGRKKKLMEEIDALDPDDRHYTARKADLDERLYKMYDKIEDVENKLLSARAKKATVEAEGITADNIYRILLQFDKLYVHMDEDERRALVKGLISKIQLWPERQPNGQWLKSIRFSLPIIPESMEIGLEQTSQTETVVQLVRKNPDMTVSVTLNLEDADLTASEAKATYDQIKAYVLETFGLRVTSLQIAQTKRKQGLPTGEHYNLSQKENQVIPNCPPEKESAIREALRHFRMI